MSINKKSLKALALGTVLTFGFAGLAATPANAATAGVTFKLDGDSTVTNTTLGSYFDLRLELDQTAKAALIAANDDDTLKFKFTQSNEDDYWYEVDGGSTQYDNNNSFKSGATTYVDAGNVLEIGTDSDVTTSVTVQAWFDGNGDGVINDTYKSDPITIKFLANADIKATTTLDTPAIGSAGLFASATTSPELNGDFTTDVEIDFIEGTAAATFADGKWSADTTVSTILKDETYSAQLLIGGDEVGNKSTKESAKVDSVEFVSIELAENANSVNHEYGVYSSYSEIRETSHAATLLVTARNKYGLPVGAGVRVTTTVVMNDVYDNATVKVGGKKIADAGSLAGTKTLSGLTNSSGQVSYAISSDYPTAGDDFDVEASAQGASNYYTQNIEWTAPYVVVYDENDASALEYDDSNWQSSFDRLVKEDGSYTFNFLVTDQFKQPFKYTRLDYETEDDTNSTVSQDIVSSTDGKFAIKVTDQSGYSGNYLDELIAYFEVAKSATSTVLDYTTYTYDIDVYTNGAADVDFNGSPSVSDGYSVSPFDFVDRNRTTSQKNSTLWSQWGYDTNSMRDYAWVDIDTEEYGQPVTFSGSGLLFLTGEGTYFKDSVTVYSDSNANAGVYIASRTSGKKTVGISTLGDKTSAKVEFYSDDLATFSSTVPAVTQPGRAIDVQVRGLDVNGNDVFDGTYGFEDYMGYGVTYVDYKLSGNVGYLSDTVDGRAAWVIGSNDHGAAKLEATYTDSNGDDWAVSNTSLVGVKATATAGYRSVGVYVTWAKGSVVKLKVGGKVVAKKTAKSSAFYFKKTGLASGAKHVAIFVDGIRVYNGVKLIK